MTVLLDIQDLRVSFGRGSKRVEAVRGVSLSLGAGEVLAVVGESGSGKSLTARSVLRLLPEGAEAGGAVLVSGQNVLSLDQKRLAKLRGPEAAMVFQEPSAALNPVFRVGWQIEEGLRAHGVSDPLRRRSEAVAMLRAVGIPDPEERIDYFPHQFSGGQKQRIVIAMALAMKPKIIIADEPTTALDVTVQAEILDLLRRCRDDWGASILLITHNMGVVADLADRVAVMRHGEIVEVAPVAQLFAAPQAPYTRELLAAVPRLSRRDATITEPPEDPSLPLAVEVAGLEVSYGPAGRGRGFKAVKGVDFTIPKGEVLGLVGESGSGKSTIGRALAGLVPISGGRVRLLGQDLLSTKGAALRDLRRRIGFVFQDPVSSFNAHLSIFDCIAEPLRIHQVFKQEAALAQRVYELLDQVQLSRSYAGRMPYELSGGQRQRVGVARALALDPDFVIADEPTSALDVSVQARLLSIFQELQRDLGFSCLFISHDLSVVEQVAARVGVLCRGELLEIGSARRVLCNPKHPYTQSLIDAVPVPDPVQQAANRARRSAMLSKG